MPNLPLIIFILKRCKRIAFMIKQPTTKTSESGFGYHVQIWSFAPKQVLAKRKKKPQMNKFVLRSNENRKEWENKKRSETAKEDIFGMPQIYCNRPDVLRPPALLNPALADREMIPHTTCTRTRLLNYITQVIQVHLLDRPGIESINERIQQRKPTAK